FQAEDGIRDRNVTGVQTCALPICKWSRRDDPVRVRYRVTKSLPKWEVLRLYRSVQWSAARKPDRLMRALKRSHCVVSAWVKGSRSEERRVGKEWRCGVGRGQCKEK